MRKKIKKSQKKGNIFVSFTTFYLKSGKKLKKVVFSAFLCPNMKKNENSSFFCIFMSKHEENRK